MNDYKRHANCYNRVIKQDTYIIIVIYNTCIQDNYIKLEFRVGYNNSLYNCLSSVLIA